MLSRSVETSDDMNKISNWCYKSPYCFIKNLIDALSWFTRFRKFILTGYKYTNKFTYGVYLYDYGVF